MRIPTACSLSATAKTDTVKLIMAVLIPVIFFAFLIYCIRYWYGSSDAQETNLPPGPPKTPLIGNSLIVDRAYPHKSMLALAEKFGNMFTLHLPDPIVVLMEPHKLTQFLRETATSGRPNSFLYRLFIGNSPDGDGIILSQGKRWQELRRFALKTLHDFGMGKTIMTDNISFHVNNLLRQMSSKCDNGGFESQIDMHMPLAYCIGNIINVLIMGRSYEYLDPEFLKFKRLIDNTLEGFASPSMQFVNRFPYLRYFVPYYYKYVVEGFDIQKFFLNVIDTHDWNYDINEEPTNLIDAFLKERQNNPEWSDLSCALMAGDIWTGGMETTVTTIRWGILYLIHYPEVQKRLQDEIDEVLDNNPPTLDHKTRMPVVQATIDELQRISNVLPWGIPHMTTDDVEIHNQTLPKGTVIMPQWGATHHDPKYFPEPDKFNIDRFLDNEFYNPNNALMPFGSGKRACMGASLAKMELYMIFTSLVQNFEFKSATDELPSLERQPGMTAVPKPYICRIKQRKPHAILYIPPDII